MTTEAKAASQDEAVKTAIPVENTPEGAKQEKVPNALLLPNSDKLGEQVEAVISDKRGERDLLTQSLLKRTSATDHAIGMLRTMGAVVDEVPDPGKPGETVTAWAGLPIWTNLGKSVMVTEKGQTHPKYATFAEISRQITPNPDNWGYKGDKSRKADKERMHRMSVIRDESGEAVIGDDSGIRCIVDGCDKFHIYGEYEYSDNVDMVAGALKAGRDKLVKSGMVGVTVTKRTSTTTPANPTDAASPATPAILSDQDKVDNSIETLTYLLEVLKSDKWDATPDSGAILASLAREFAQAWEPAESDKSDKPLVPVTPATTRRTAAKR